MRTVVDDLGGLGAHDLKGQRVPIIRRWSPPEVCAADELARSKGVGLVRLLGTNTYLVLRSERNDLLLCEGGLEECVKFMLGYPARTRRMAQLSDFAAMVRELRVLVPPTWKVKVRRLKLPEGHHGDCALIAKPTATPYFAIRVERHLDEQAQVFVLLHEWAHALSWGSESHRIDEHGPEWGLAMSRVWQAVIES